MSVGSAANGVRPCERRAPSLRRPRPDHFIRATKRASSFHGRPVDRSAGGARHGGFDRKNTGERDTHAYTSRVIAKFPITIIRTDDGRTNGGRTSDWPTGARATAADYRRCYAAARPLTSPSLESLVAAAAATCSHIKDANFPRSPTAPPTLTTPFPIRDNGKSAAAADVHTLHDPRLRYRYDPLTPTPFAHKTRAAFDYFVLFFENIKHTR